MGLSPEITQVAEADALKSAEGNTVARTPGTDQRVHVRRLTGVRGQGMRTRVPQEPGRSRRHRRETELPSRVQASRAGAPGSRNAAVGAKKQGNHPKGPCRAKGGIGTRNHWRER